MGLFGKKKTDAVADATHDVTLEDGSLLTVSQVVDCLGDSCPRPQLMTKAALAKAKSGETVEIQIDNSTSVEAIPPMMPELDARHVATIRKDKYWQVLLQKN